MDKMAGKAFEFTPKHLYLKLDEKNRTEYILSVFLTANYMKQMRRKKKWI